MASIASQLQAIKSALGSAPEAPRGPITRPSVLFDAKEAADIDLRAILPIALSGDDPPDLPTRSIDLCMLLLLFSCPAMPFPQLINSLFT
jgi:hypothetical protein